MRRTLAAALIALAAPVLVTPALADVTVESANDFETTMTKLREAIAASPASIVTEIDHAAAATDAGLTLDATTLIVFGNPAAGTQLMNADRASALALPMKMLVIEVKDGVRLVYDDPADLADAYDLGEAAAVTQRMSGLVAGLAEAAAAK